MGSVSEQKIFFNSEGLTMPFPLAPGFLGGATFLGAKVRSFQASLSWNYGGPSQLQVSLADDPSDSSLFAPPELGTPVVFQYGSFRFEGLLQRRQRNRGTDGNPLYEVDVIDPREILDGCALILGGYSGTVTTRNVISPFGYWESIGFGMSFSNEGGMPWFRVRDALLAIANQPTITNYGGPLHYRGYNYGLDLTELPVPPDSYRVGAQVTSLFDVIAQLCEDGGCDFFTELSGGNIRIRTVSRASQPPLGTMSALADSDYGIRAVRISEGLESRNELTAAMLVGGQVTALQEATNLRQFWGWDINGNPIVGTLGTLDFFDKGGLHVPFVGPVPPPALIQAVDTERMFLNASALADVLGSVQYECTTLEMRLAQANIETWELYIATHRPGIQALFEAPPLFKNVVDGGFPVAAVRANFINADNAEKHALVTADARARKLRLYEFVRGSADEFMGRKFLVPLPSVQSRIDPETLLRTDSLEVADSGYLPDGSTPLGLSDANQDLFRLPDGRFRAFVKFQEIEGVDLSKVSPSGAVIEGNNLFSEVQVDESLVSLEGEPYALITLSGPVVEQARDNLGDVGLLGNILQMTEAEFQDKMRNVIIPLKIAPAVREPEFAAIPLRSNILTYGPWAAQGAIGKVRVEQDPSLVPWNYGGFAGMEAAALARVTTAVTQAQVIETAFLEREGLPEVSLGDTLRAGGPNVTNISVQIGPQGITTLYRFQTFSARFGVPGRGLSEQLRSAAATSARIKRDVRAAAREGAAKRRAFAVAAETKKAFLDKEAKAAKRETPHDVLRSYSEFAGSGLHTQLDAMTYEEAVVNSNADDTEQFNRTAVMGWPGLFRPFTTGTGPGTGVMPPLASSTEVAGVPNRHTLDFWKGPNDVEVYTWGGTYDGMHARRLDPDTGDARVFGLRGPMMVVGWGYSISGVPVPAGPNGFADNHLTRQDTWKAGPVDLLWDEKRGVWTSHDVFAGWASGVIAANGYGTMKVDGNGVSYPPLRVYNRYGAQVATHKKIHAAYVATHNRWELIAADC